MIQCGNKTKTCKNPPTATCSYFLTGLYPLSIPHSYTSHNALLLYLFVKPVALDHWGIGVPLDGVGPFAKVVNFFGRPRGLWSDE